MSHALCYIAKAILQKPKGSINVILKIPQNIYDIMHNFFLHFANQWIKQENLGNKVEREKKRTIN